MAHKPGEEAAKPIEHTDDDHKNVFALPYHICWCVLYAGTTFLVVRIATRDAVLPDGAQVLGKPLIPWGLLVVTWLTVVYFCVYGMKHIVHYAMDTEKGHAVMTLATLSIEFVPALCALYMAQQCNSFALGVPVPMSVQRAMFLGCIALCVLLITAVTAPYIFSLDIGVSAFGNHYLEFKHFSGLAIVSLIRKVAIAVIYYTLAQVIIELWAMPSPDCELFGQLSTTILAVLAMIYFGTYLVLWFWDRFSKFEALGVVPVMGLILLLAYIMVPDRVVDSASASRSMGPAIVVIVVFVVLFVKDLIDGRKMGNIAETDRMFVLGRDFVAWTPVVSMLVLSWFLLRSPQAQASRLF